VADAAAYSNAIATARTMNTMAVMNRAMIAHTVSTIGAMSLISYATLYWADAQAAKNLFAIQLGLVIAGTILWCALCGPWCPVCCARCNACIQSVLLVLPSFILMTIHERRIRGRLNQDIQVYNGETYPRWVASSSLFTSAVSMYDGSLRNKIQSNTGSFAEAYLSQARVGNATALNSAASTLNSAELGR